MLKRLVDLSLSATGIVLTLPITLPVMFLIWRQDKHSPFYIAERMGAGEKPFKMYKLRSMVMNADKSGVDSTSAGDKRITKVGHFVRRYKLDELSQLINVFLGDMSLVGPRPNVKRETDLYTGEEKRLLSIKPGITDFSSIVFSDEGDILADKEDPDIAYNQLIRPWKSRLGLFYIDHSSLIVDIKLIWLTALAIVSREKALKGVTALLQELRASQELMDVASRSSELVPTPPPGAAEIVTTRTAS